VLDEVRPGSVTASSRSIARNVQDARRWLSRRGLESIGVGTEADRREELKAVWRQAQGCVKCPQLASTRTTVVFGSGNADADLMFVGEAPGANEDKQGLPFVGQAGRLLERLLEEIGMQRADVFIANVLKCRPPQNRDPLPQEIDACQDYLFRQLELIQPRVVCTLGNFSTKLLRADATGITKLHGHEEVRRIGPRIVRLYPIYHPAAALYTPAMLETLRRDFARIPELLALEPPEQAAPPAEPLRDEPQLAVPEPAVAEPLEPLEPPRLHEPAELPGLEEEPEPRPDSSQLGLF
jgi:DNA polymerase